MRLTKREITILKIY